jgi:hypothetical protein
LEKLGIALISPNVVVRIEAAKQQNFLRIKDNLKKMFFDFAFQVELPSFFEHFIMLNSNILSIFLK